MDIRKGASESVVVAYDTSVWQPTPAASRPRTVFFLKGEHVATVTFEKREGAESSVDDFLAQPEEWTYTNFRWVRDADGHRVRLVDPPSLASSEHCRCWHVVDWCSVRSKRSIFVV